MASRSSRKRGRTQRPERPAPVSPDGELSRAEKTEAKNQAVRDELEPLDSGQRPQWVTYSALLAALLGILNVALYVAGVRVHGATLTNAVGGGVILLVCAAGMWFAQYWAVLGFEVLLGITCVYGALSLLVANSWAGALRSLIVLGVGAVFFYKLVRAMARIQMPQRP